MELHDHDAAHALLEGDAVDVVGERDVGCSAQNLASLLSCQVVAVHPGRAHEAAVDDRVGAAEVLAILVAVRVGQIGDHEAGHLLAAPGRGDDVDRHQVPALGELLEHALADIAGRAP